MKRLSLILIIFIISANLFGQPLYPVRTITTVSPPYPTSLEQYANVEDGHISLTIIPSDIALQNYPVRLRLVINGGYYKIYTNPSFVHKSIVLNNGENISLTGPELAEWFNPENLIFEGYTKNQYQKTGRLPEGMYQIWFEVYDFYRDINISGSLKELKATVWTFENDPPMLNFPANEKEVPATDPQNIVLNWTQRQSPFSSAGAANQYKLEVWEIIPDDMNVEEAVRTTRPVYAGEVQTTTFNYSSDQPILFPGKKYAWRVQVYDPAGKNRYKNDGYSEVRWFRFGKDCTAPTPMLDKIYFTAASLKWENDIRFEKYELRWKNKDIANSNWYTRDATGQGSTIDKLEQNTSYYVQIRGFCGVQEGEFSPSLTVHTKQDANFACGGAPGVLDSADNIPLAALNKGEIFRAYDFDIETYQVSGGNGNFTGKGFALVPLLKSIKFEVEFSGITINSKRRMTNGEVKFIYNEKNGLLVSVNPLINAIIGDKTENNPYEDIANKKTSVNAPITSINVSASGDVTIVTEDGHKETVRASADNGDMVYIGGSNDDAEQTVVDTKSKTVYTGTPEKSSSGSGTGGLGTAAIKQPTGKNEPVKYAVTFLPHTLTTLGGMDYPSNSAPKGNYNNATIGGTEVLVPWKSVESNKIDRLVAAVDGPADSIHFITKNENMVMTAPGDKSAVSANVQGSNVELLNSATFKQILVTGVDNTDELKAWYPEYEKVNDTTTQQNRILAGQVNIAAYDKIEQDVCIVEVNGAAVPDALPIEQELNKIYASALVHWKVTTIKNFNVALTTLKDGKFDSNHPGSMEYNNCEDEVIDAFKNRKDYSRKTVYLFFIGGQTTNLGTKGYMQFNRNFGFIFRDNQDLNELIRTMGHELGHGVFRLRHVFSPECPYPQTEGDTYNLMDYVDKSKATTAILMHNYQWKEVHDWDLGVNWFEGGSEGEYEIGQNETIGIAPNGQIIVKYNNKFGLIIIRNGPNDLYTIKSFKAILPGDQYVLYNWDYTKQKYIPDTEKLNENSFSSDDFVLLNSDESKITFISKVLSGNCVSLYQKISWKNKDDVLKLDDIAKKGVWYMEWQYNAAKDCMNQFYEAIKTHDVSQECTNELTIQAYVEQLKNAITKKIKVTELVNYTNIACLNSLRLLDYTTQESLFKNIALQKNFVDGSELALLRLMSCIKQENYSKFFTLLEKDSSKLISQLVDQFGDKFIFWGENNFTNFIRGLVIMVAQSPDIYLNKIADFEDEKLFGQVLNLDEKNFNDDVTKPDLNIAGVIFGDRAITGFRYSGELIDGTGKVEISREKGVFNNLATIWEKDDRFKPINLSPLTPVFVTTVGGLDLVKYAIEGTEISSNTYIVPAIFLHYKRNKELNDAFVKAGFTSLDILTIGMSGGTMLATKVYWVKRIWALAEVAGAITNIGVTTEVINNKSVIAANNIFSLGMGAIGIKNAAIGLTGIAKSLVGTTKELIKNNKSIKAVVLSSYLNWKAALKEVGEINPNERKLIEEQYAVYSKLGVTPQNEGKVIAWEKAIKIAEEGGTNIFKVDNTLKAADEAAGVLVNGSYLKNPTAKNVTELIKNPSGAMKLDQSSSSILNGQYMYVVDEADNIIIGTRAKGFNFSVPDGKAPHPTLIGGPNPTVKCAGIIEFRSGKIYKVDNVSGHFKPSAQSLQNSQSIFNQRFSPNNFADDFQGYIPFTD